MRYFPEPFGKCVEELSQLPLLDVWEKAGGGGYLGLDNRERITLQTVLKVSGEFKFDRVTQKRPRATKRLDGILPYNVRLRVLQCNPN